MMDPIYTKFIFAEDDQIANEPLMPGMIILSDKGKLYLDRPDGTARLTITDIIIVDTETARLAVMTPINGFYFVSETSKLYYWNQRWECLNPDPAFIGSNGKILTEYLPDGTVMTYEGVIPGDILPTATSTIFGAVRLGSTGGAARYGKPEDVGLSQVTNDRQVKESDLGEPVTALTTEAKTLVGAINELHRLIMEKN